MMRDCSNGVEIIPIDVVIVISAIITIIMIIMIKFITVIIAPVSIMIAFKSSALSAKVTHQPYLVSILAQSPRFKPFDPPY